MFCLVYNWQRYYSCKGSVSYHSRLCWAPSSAPPPPSPLVSHASPPLLFFPLLTLWLEVALILRVFKAYAALSGHTVVRRCVFLHAWSWLMTEPCAGSSSRDPPHRLCMLTSEKRSARSGAALIRRHREADRPSTRSPQSILSSPRRTLLISLIYQFKVKTLLSGQLWKIKPAGIPVLEELKEKWSYQERSVSLSL